jgi:hypothetical protein
VDKLVCETVVARVNEAKESLVVVVVVVVDDVPVDGVADNDTNELNVRVTVLDNVVVKYSDAVSCVDGVVVTEALGTTLGDGVNEVTVNVELDGGAVTDGLTMAVTVAVVAST